MVSSVYFPEKGSGYIYMKPENPGNAPSKDDYRYRKFGVRMRDFEFDEEKYNKDYEKWKSDKEYYDENKGKYVNPCAKNLIGRKFTFEPGKVNIIFGPNGSGKTTILRAIAGEAGIDKDGFTHPADPTKIFGFTFEGKKRDAGQVRKYIDSLKHNTSDVEWDGNVVYYDNFAETVSWGNGYFGGLVGSVFSSFEEEVAYRMGSVKISSGQKSGYLLGKVVNYQKSGITLESIFDKVLQMKCNDTWSGSYKLQAEHFKRFENYGKVVPMTFLFDEPEVNFDIATVWKLYSELFPMICDKFGTQIITVSHSPLILGKDIFENEMVNVISIDENYTEEMRGLMRNITF